MRSRRLSPLLPLYVGLLGASCAQMSARPFRGASDATAGIRLYEPTPFLVVTDKDAQVVFVPNPNRGVAVGFNTWVAKHRFELKAQDGRFAEFSSDADTTALASGLLTLVQTIGPEGVKSVTELAKLLGAQPLGEKVTGTIATQPGVYAFQFDEKGEFTGLRDLLFEVRMKQEARAEPRHPPK
ncbi:MAG TPA: hypothetical protein VFI25_17660 [Planctomycetota bacterium]|jgi:hypothetical protein|nr:hypothetical protein [Planctomycetota bacterium]